MDKALFSSEKTNWETPQELFDRLNAEFHFTLDAAADDLNHKLPHYYTLETNGLDQDWGGERVFCNPPYGDKDTGVWTQKCWEEAQKPNTLVVLLIPARTDRKSFHDFIYEKPGVEIRFLKGRLKFEDKGQAMGTAPFPSMLCIFQNIKEETIMATTTKKSEEAEKSGIDYSFMNVYQKLQLARIDFLRAGVKKSGKNIKLEFMYFELADIVPVAENIFAKFNLLGVTHFSADTGYMDVYDGDHPEAAPITFSAPFTVIQPIISSRTGGAVTNEMQALGSSITYMRRYLWQLVMDIIEIDTIDGTLGSDEDAPAEAAKPVKQKPPVTAEKRQEIKKELTAPAAPADELQITALKAGLKQLLELDPEQENFVQEIAVRTESFTKISKEACEKLVLSIGEMIDAYGAQEG